ncbi:MAG: hypothetical protein CSA70_04100 [Rhodobacterales bacterium]|nr:MAG: hypothetical protein CSA70_04100 [Rhodobacterales bacterium]
MCAPLQHIDIRQAGLALGLAGMAALAGCDRHDETGARSLAAQWFDLGETVYFNSHSACTAAVFRAKSGALKAQMPLFSSVEAVMANGRQNAFALSVDGMTADQMFIDVMNADRPTGVAMQAAGLEARNCMDEATRTAFYNALRTEGGVVVFSREAGAFAVLDPQSGLVVLTSGAV